MCAMLTILLFLLGDALECFLASPLGLFTEKELDCFSQEKIYDKDTNSCYKLLTRGPCPRGHWFVLEKPNESLQGNINTTIRGICVREICKDGEFYWPVTKSCVKWKDKKRLCGDGAGQELLTNVFGEGECACTRNPPRARLNGDRKKVCYLLYTQGPCPPTKILGFMGRSEIASCIPDPCYTETLYKKRNRTLSKDSILAAWKNGTCYELGTQGPCPDGLTFKVHPIYKRPNCGVLLNVIFGGLDSCNKDENNICQQKVKQRKRSIAAKFMKELQQIFSQKK